MWKNKELGGYYLDAGFNIAGDDSFSLVKLPLIPYFSRMLDLPKRIFWDTNMIDIDWDAHARFVIERVITHGRIEDWVMIKAYYGIDRIKEEILQIRFLDDKTLNFFSVIFDIEKEQFRCYKLRASLPECCKVWL